MTSRKPAKPEGSTASPFANLGRDTSLLRDTRPDGPSREPASQTGSLPVEQISGMEERQKSGTPELPVPSSLTKIGYRISTEAIDAVDEMYRVLRRRHGIKGVTRQRIVEQVILAANDDLTKNGAASDLARKLSGQAERKTAS